MDSSKEFIGTKQFISILEKIYPDKKFKYAKVTYYFHNGMFDFIDDKVGGGYYRKFSYKDVVAMVCGVGVLLEYSRLDKAKEAANFIRKQIEAPVHLRTGIALFGGTGDPTFTKWQDDTIAALKRDIEENGIDEEEVETGGAVTIRSDGLPKVDFLKILPVYKIAKAVEMLWDKI